MHGEKIDDEEEGAKMYNNPEINKAQCIFVLVFLNYNPT